MKKRYAFFDLIKFVLIFLVVFGHAIEPYLKSPIMKAIYLTIYSFHMPLFVFISGFFARYDLKRAGKFLFLYLILQMAHMLINALIAPFAGEGFSILSVLGAFFSPQWTLWFLPALAVWIVSLKLVKNFHLKIFVLSIFITLVLGYLPFINSALTLSRIFYFYPFFILGNYFGQNKDLFVEKLKKLQTPLFKFVSVMVIVIFFFLFLHKELPKEFFYGSIPYQNSVAVFGRVFALGAGFVVGLAVLILIPASKENNNLVSKIVSHCGRKTLSIYIVHSLILIVLQKFCINLIGNLPVLAIAAISFILATALVLLTSTIDVDKFFGNPIFNSKSIKQ